MKSKFSILGLHKTDGVTDGTRVTLVPADLATIPDALAWYRDNPAFGGSGYTVDWVGVYNSDTDRTFAKRVKIVPKP